MSQPGTQAVTLRDFPRDLWRRIRAAAALRGISPRAIIVEALTDWLKKETV